MKRTPLDAREIGERVRVYCESPASYKILGPQGTWMTGGCTLLAIALQDALREAATHRHLHADVEEARTGILFNVATAESPHDHTVLMVGDFYLDADGAQTRQELFRKMRDVEMRQRT